MDMDIVVLIIIILILLYLNVKNVTAATQKLPDSVSVPPSGASGVTVLIKDDNVLPPISKHAFVKLFYDDGKIHKINVKDMQAYDGSGNKIPSVANVSDVYMITLKPGSIVKKVLVQGSVLGAKIAILDIDGKSLAESSVISTVEPLYNLQFK